MLISLDQIVSNANNLVSSPQIQLSNSVPKPYDIRGILFDIDGTLCHSDPIHFEIFQVPFHFHCACIADNDDNDQYC